MGLAYSICLHPATRWPFQGPKSEVVEPSLVVLYYLDDTAAGLIKLIQQILKGYDSVTVVRRCFEFLDHPGRWSRISSHEFTEHAVSFILRMTDIDHIWSLLIKEKMHLRLLQRAWVAFRPTGPLTLSKDPDSAATYGGSLALRLVDIFINENTPVELMSSQYFKRTK